MRPLRTLTVLAAVLPMALLPAATAQAAPPRSGTYLALGDSVAAGTGASDPATKGYVALLADDLRSDCAKGRTGAQDKGKRGAKGKGAKAGGCRIELVDLAVDGATTASLIAEQLPAALALIEERNGNGSPHDDVRLITLTIGGNDVVGPVAAACAGGLTPTCTQTVVNTISAAGRNLMAIMDALRAAAGPETTIAVTTYYNGLENPDCRLHPLAQLGWIVLEGGLLGDAGPLKVGLNDRIRIEAWLKDALVVETAQVVDPRTEVLTDCLHPDDAGHADIAEAFAAVIGDPFAGGHD
jgi:lysophospholipase L1-like esterase